MTEAFIKNEQLNFIKKQISNIKESMNKSLPKTVLAAVMELAEAKIFELFPQATSDQQELLDISKWKTKDEYEQYIERLAKYVLPFPKITEQQLKKLFPKQKKLRLPDFATIDLHQLTYLSWTDGKSNRKFVIHELDGKLVGVEGKMTPTNKKIFVPSAIALERLPIFQRLPKTRNLKMQIITRLSET